MQKPSILFKIFVGIRQNPWKLVLYTFLAYATIWVVLESLLGLVPSAQQYFSGEAKFLTLLFLSICIGVYRNTAPNRIRIKCGSSSIVVLFGDLFLHDGYKVVPVSRYFFETQIVPTSLQHKIIQTFIQSREGDEGFTLYRNSLSTALENITHEEIYRDETKRKENYYPLGTTELLA
jgi:hypothetical protein